MNHLHYLDSYLFYFVKEWNSLKEWKATALEAEMWVQTVTEGGWRFMAAWRK